MENHFDEFKRIYETYFNKPLKPSFINTWYKSSPAEASQTPHNFKNYLLNNQEYIAYVDTKYQHIYNRLVIAPYVSKYSFDFLKTIAEKPATDDLIYNYIIKSEPYKIFISELIVLFYKTITNRSPRQEVIDHYMHLFHDDKNYSYEILQKDICQSENVVEDKIAIIQKEYLGIKGKQIALKELLDITKSLNDNTQIVRALISSTNIFNNTLLYHLIDSFNDIYDRDIHVFEFIKYYNNLCLQNYGSTNKAIDTSLNEIHQNYIEKLAVVRGLYSKYIAVKLVETDYIRKYLDVTDKVDYVDIIIDELIELSDYEKLMKEKISDLYQITYGLDISLYDLLYIYKTFKNAKYHLEDENLSKNIIKIYELTQTYNNELEMIFNDILKRQADPLEYETFMTRYREDEDIKTTNLTISEELYDSLEYQMVLTETIRELYKEIHNKQAIPSIVYKILQSVLTVNNECKTDREELAKFITNFQK